MRKYKFHFVVVRIDSISDFNLKVTKAEAVRMIEAYMLFPNVHSAKVYDSDNTLFYSSVKVPL